MEAYTEHDAAAEAADGKRRDYGAADVAAMKEAIALSATALQNAAAGEEPMGGPFGAVIYKDGKRLPAGATMFWRITIRRRTARFIPSGRRARLWELGTYRAACFIRAASRARCV